MSGARVLEAQRKALLETAEAVGVGAAFVDRAGAPLAANPAFLALYADEESRTRIAEHVRARFAAATGCGPREDAVPLRPRRIAAARVLPGEDIALVQVRGDGPPAAAPDLDALGLTRAQKRVAEALAAGLDNRAIAARLGITEYTARRHTERVFAKLGVRTRAAAAVRLMGSG